jgi:hypothetical protein
MKRTRDHAKRLRIMLQQRVISWRGCVLCVSRTCYNTSHRRLSTGSAATLTGFQVTTGNRNSVEKRVRQFVSLCHYHDWSLTLRALAVPALNEAAGGNGRLLAPTVALLSYWFVSLKVLAEGWSKLQLGDPVIDDLLSSPHSALLQRYRNGVCHYQSDFASAKFADLTADSDTIAWVKKLDQAFYAYFQPHHPNPNVRLIEDWARS